jgi:hypothetical protein
VSPIGNKPQPRPNINRGKLIQQHIPPQIQKMGINFSRQSITINHLFDIYLDKLKGLKI